MFLIKYLRLIYYLLSVPKDFLNYLSYLLCSLSRPQYLFHIRTVKKIVMIIKFTTKYSMQLPTSQNIIINILFDLLPFSQETEAKKIFCWRYLNYRSQKTLPKFDGIILYSWLHEIIYSIYVQLFVPYLIFLPQNGRRLQFQVPE